MWGAFLSEPLPIKALVSRYLTNKLIGRIPIRCRKKTLPRIGCRQRGLWGISPAFTGLSPSSGKVGYALLTRAPVAITDRKQSA